MHGNIGQCTNLASVESVSEIMAEIRYSVIKIHLTFKGYLILIFTNIQYFVSQVAASLNSSTIALVESQD